LHLLDGHGHIVQTKASSTAGNYQQIAADCTENLMKTCVKVKSDLGHYQPFASAGTVTVSGLEPNPLHQGLTILRFS